MGKQVLNDKLQKFDHSYKEIRKRKCLLKIRTELRSNSDRVASSIFRFLGLLISMNIDIAGQKGWSVKFKNIHSEQTSFQRSNSQFKSVQSAPELTLAPILQNQSGLEFPVAQIKISNYSKSWTYIYTVIINS